MSLVPQEVVWSPPVTRHLRMRVPGLCVPLLISVRRLSIIVHETQVVKKGRQEGPSRAASSR